MIEDDAREKELIGLFGLKKAPDAGRSDTDALLEYKGKDIQFELKSSTRGSITTVRDFGPDHIKKWQTKHWLIGVYDKNAKLQFCLYGSPADMQPWIEQKARYIEDDFKLAQYVPTLITKEVMYRILGEKTVYSLEDAKKLQKKQYTADEYRKRKDVPEGYSPERMLSILRDRCRYVIERGSTLNNPHIPTSYFDAWPKIKPGDRTMLLSLVDKYFTGRRPSSSTSK